MIVKKYRLDLGERNIRSRSDGKWLTREEQRNRGGGCYAIWSNTKEFLSRGRLINNFEEFFDISMPADWEENIIEIEYDIPEGEFVLTKCFPSWEYNDFHPNRNLFRFCKSVSEVLEYLEDSNMEVFRVVLGQFRLEKNLTTLYVRDPYNDEKRCWKYPGA